MKIKTSELSDMALCYTLCMIERPDLTWGETIGIHHASRQIVVPSMPSPQRYSPYMNWASFGPIIDKLEGFHLKIWLESKPDTKCEAHIHNYEGDWIAFGPTPLIAAMRTFVASRLGDEVDVPEALTP